MLVTNVVFSAVPRDQARADFHPATNLDANAAQDMGEWRHDGGWSVDASMHLPGWDHHLLERLARYCARPALTAGRLGRLVDLLAPPRKHCHRYFGVLAPRARLRPIVTATAGPAGTVLQELATASKAMGLAEPQCSASRSWALRLARIYENRLLQCPHCGQAMTILAFILDQEVIERFQRHIGEETISPRVLPARSPPQQEMDFAQSAGPVTRDEVNQTTEFADEP
jgi:hypothetical protein